MRVLLIIATVLVLGQAEMGEDWENHLQDWEIQKFDFSWELGQYIHFTLLFRRIFYPYPRQIS